MVLILNRVVIQSFVWFILATFLGTVIYLFWNFEQITYIGNEPVDAEIYYMKKAEREREARREYRKGKKEKADINELFILDIMREGIKNGDARLF